MAVNRAEKARREADSVHELAVRDVPYRRLGTLTKLFLTILYIAVMLSFSKYDITGLLFMVLFPLIGYQFALLPVRTCFVRLRYVLPLVCAVGLFNPFFDRTVLFVVGRLQITGGIISMLTLMLKGIFALMAAFLLMATTPVEELCKALRKIHVPKMIVSLLLLTVRYTDVLLEQVAVMTDAYHLRAPKQKGIQFSAWGTFLGQLLLRSMDRADALYESMVMRGFHGEFTYVDRTSVSVWSVPIALAASAAFAAARIWNIPLLISGLFV